MNPEVSIILPTYNQAKYLYQAIESVINQTFQNWECIVINNYSEDNTISIVNNFEDQRVRLVNFANKGIIAASRNKGINLARSDIIAFLDSDDFWDRDKLNECLDVLNNGYDLVCHAEFWLSNKSINKVVKYFICLL